jgi:hypothetical protein
LVVWFVFRRGRLLIVSPDSLGTACPLSGRNCPLSGRGGATLAAFIAAARNQSKSNWDPRYTADAVNSYIEAGFVTTVGGLAGSVSINDVTISEGNSGTKVATFTSHAAAARRHSA